MFENSIVLKQWEQSVLKKGAELKRTLKLRRNMNFRISGRGFRLSVMLIFPKTVTKICHPQIHTASKEYFRRLFKGTP